MTELDALQRRHPAFGRAVDGMPGAVQALGRLAGAGLLGGTLAKYLDGAGDDAMQAFANDAAACDVDWVLRLRAELRDPPAGFAALSLEPVVPTRLEGSGRDGWADAGRRSLAAGEWADVVFAGGAATRFFTEAGDDPAVRDLVARYGGTPPKGVYPLTPVLGRSFVQRIVGEATAAGIASGRVPVLLFMTSGQTDAAIRDWIATADHGGYPRDLLWPMRQAEHPRLDPDGDLVARRDGRLVVTGDGHGGVWRALEAAGPGRTSFAERLRALGIRFAAVHNVDNAAARPFEASRLGFHASGALAFTMTVTPRSHAYEKVGLVARNLATGRIEVVEYSVCPPALAEATNADGSPVFELAHISVNLVSLADIRTDLPRTLYTGKKVDVDGRVVPTASHEMLNQHLSGLLDAGRVGVLRVDRDAFFLPTKSLHGEDSLQTTREAMSRADAARLAAAGARVAGDATIELDPCLDGAPGPGIAGAAHGWTIGDGARVGLALRHGADGAPALSADLSVGRGARLAIEVDRPFGEPSFDAGTRSFGERPATAGRVVVGRDVAVADGADVVVRVRGDGRVRIPDGARLEGTVRIEVGPGQTRVLGGMPE